MNIRKNKIKTFVSLQLGLSFSVPFFSIPMDSLLNLGGLGGFGNLEGGYSDDTALVDALSINWPTVTAIGQWEFPYFSIDQI